MIDFEGPCRTNHPKLSSNIQYDPRVISHDYPIIPVLSHHLQEAEMVVAEAMPMAGIGRAVGLTATRLHCGFIKPTMRKQHENHVSWL